MTVLWGEKKFFVDTPGGVSIQDSQRFKLQVQRMVRRFKGVDRVERKVPRPTG